MFIVNEDKSMSITRGDAAAFDVEATHQGGAYTFKTGDVLRFKVFEQKNCTNVVLCKDTYVNADTTSVKVSLDGEDTKVGEVNSKPVTYWYEVELNPDTKPQTIIGYDDDGPKVFKVFPEGAEV